MPEAFFDTNVLLYLLSADNSKADAAEAVIAAGGHLSVQVLNEFTSVARGKAKLSWPEIGDTLGSVRQVCTVHPLTEDTHDLARRLAEQHQLHIYDALIVAAAALAACTTLYSEDLQDGQRFENSVTVRNPFLRQPPEPPAR